MIKVLWLINFIYLFICLIKEVNEAVMKEYLERVYSGILSNAELKDLGEGISQLLVEQAQAVVLMHR